MDLETTGIDQEITITETDGRIEAIVRIGTNGRIKRKKAKSPAVAIAAAVQVHQSIVHIS